MALGKILNIEKVIIEIDPDTNSYEMNMAGCSLSRLIWVLDDIRDKLVNQRFDEGLKITDLDGKDIDKEERDEIFAKIKEEDTENN